MSNVLPPENQKRILASQRTRFIFVFAEVAIVVAFVFYIMLLPSTLMLAYTGNKTEEDPTATSTAAAYNTTLREAKLSIMQLDTVLKATTTPSTIVDAVLAAKPEGIAIDTMMYTKGSPGKMVVGGHAARPDLIQAFRTALDADTRFDSVNIPVSAVFGSDTGAFTITISGTF
ncbi:hypothetical protein C4568_04460 [Candidatus Parcubacteria bacterium]|nr:MAG: hypothetical protein C4568_04460 [Candidatus Parcubacteria bacterium]